MPLKSRKSLVIGLGILLAGYLLYRFHGSLHLSQFSGTTLLHSLRGANYFYLFLAVVCIYACYALRSLRWLKFQQHVGPSNFWNIYGMNLAGFSVMLVLGRAADPLRPLLIARKEKIAISGTFGIYALERILDAACTAVLAAIGLLIFESSGRHEAEGTAQAFEKGARTAGTAFALAATVAIVGLVYLRLHGSGVLERRMQGWLAQHHGWRTAFARNLLEFVRGVQTIRSAGDAAAAVVYSAVHWWLVAVVYYLVIKSFGGILGAFSFADALLILVFSLVGSAVQLPMVGGGAQALTMVALMKLYGVEQEPAFAAAMVLWLISFAFCAFAGIPLLIREGWSLGELKRLRQQEAAEIDAQIAQPSTTKSL